MSEHESISKADEVSRENNEEADSEEEDDYNVWDNWRNLEKEQTEREREFIEKVAKEVKILRSKKENALQAELEGSIRRFACGDMMNFLDEVNTFSEEETRKILKKIRRRGNFTKNVVFKHSLIIVIKALMVKFRPKRVCQLICYLNLEYFWKSREKLQWRAYRLKAAGGQAQAEDQPFSEINSAYIDDVKAKLRLVLQPEEVTASVSRTYVSKCDRKENFLFLAILVLKSTFKKQGQLDTYFKHVIAFDPKHAFLYVHGSALMEELIVEKLIAALNPKYTSAKYLQLEGIGLSHLREVCYQPSMSPELSQSFNYTTQSLPNSGRLKKLDSIDMIRIILSLGIEESIEKDHSRIEQFKQREMSFTQDPGIVEVDLLDYLASENLIPEPSPRSLRKRTLAAMMGERNSGGMKNFTVRDHLDGNKDHTVVWKFKSKKNETLDNTFKIMADRGYYQGGIIYMTALDKKKNIIDAKRKNNAAGTDGIEFQEIGDPEVESTSGSDD